jgi:hypothetical protein
MNEPFLLQVKYKNEIREFEANIQRLGYIYRITVRINGMEVYFEKDENQEYRAVLADPESRGKEIDRGLLEAVAGTLREEMK